MLPVPTQVVRSLRKGPEFARLDRGGSGLI